jgi:fatty-acyl-CoA synthase
MIIRGGENIYPREIEEFLYTHPDITRRAGVRRPDPSRYGEELCAWIKRPGTGPTPKLDTEDIRAFCQGQIAHYKIPRHVRFVEEFPMTVTGKIQKFSCAGGSGSRSRAAPVTARPTGTPAMVSASRVP